VIEQPPRDSAAHRTEPDDGDDRHGKKLEEGAVW
jgi:hypothetical protein